MRLKSVVNTCLFSPKVDVDTLLYTITIRYITSPQSYTSSCSVVDHSLSSSDIRVTDPISSLMDFISSLIIPVTLSIATTLRVVCHTV